MELEILGKKNGRCLQIVGTSETLKQLGWDEIDRPYHNHKFGADGFIKFEFVPKARAHLRPNGNGEDGRTGKATWVPLNNRVIITVTAPKTIQLTRRREFVKLQCLDARHPMIFTFNLPKSFFSDQEVPAVKYEELFSPKLLAVKNSLADAILIVNKGLIQKDPARPIKVVDNGNGTCSLVRQVTETV